MKRGVSAHRTVDNEVYDESTLVHAIAVYGMVGKWVYLTHANCTTDDRSPGCSRDVNAITANRGSTNGDSNRNRRTDSAATDRSTNSHRRTDASGRYRYVANNP
jgi:hypothetical protein